MSAAVHDVIAEADDALPGDSGVWLFIFADLCAFAVFFLVFTAGRSANPELYEASRLALDPRVGLANTVILLTSSWLVARAVHAARAGDRAGAVRGLAAALAVGATFGVSKISEWAAEVARGNTLLTNEFFAYYFAFTGIHFLHYAVGMAVLAVCVAKARRDPLDAHFRVWIESSGCYWHMVDLLWIVLFPMLYLQRAA
jgi:nitric oxide reductase NorE protein